MIVDLDTHTAEMDECVTASYGLILRRYEMLHKQSSRQRQESERMAVTATVCVCVV